MKEPIVLPEDFTVRNSSSQHQQKKATYPSISGTTPKALKSILSPKNKIKGRMRAENNFQSVAMVTSSSNFTKTLEAGSPKNFRIKSRVTIIRENSSPPNKNPGWPSKNGEEDKEPQQKEMIGSQNDDVPFGKLAFRSDRQIYQPNDESKSMSRSPRDTPEKVSTTNKSQAREKSTFESEETLTLMGGINAFTRVVLPSELSETSEHVIDCQSDTFITNLVNKLSDELKDYHAIASRLKDLLRDQRVMVEHKTSKEWIFWKEIFQAFLDKNRKILPVRNPNYC